MSHITVFYGFPDTNPGGTALGIALIDALREKLPRLDVILMSTHGDASILPNVHPYIIKKFPELKLIPFPVKTRRDYQTDSGKLHNLICKISWFGNIMLSLMYLIFPRLGLHNKSLNTFRTSVFVVGRGTNIFYDASCTSPLKRVVELFSMFNLCFPLLFAWRCRIPSVIYAQSFGPLNSPLNRRLVAYALRKTSIIYSRDYHSTAYLHNVMRVRLERIVDVPDSVFYLKQPPRDDMKSYASSQELKFKEYAVFVPRALGAPQTAEKENVIFNEIAECLFANKFIEEIVVVTHCHHLPLYNRFESDEKPAATLFKRLTDGGRLKIRLIDRSFSPDELLLLYGGARYCICGRLHASILSLVSRTPAFPFVSVGHKSRGIFEKIDLLNNVIDVKNFKVSDFLRTVSDIDSGYENYVSRIDKKMVEMQWLSSQTPERLQKLIK